MGDSRLSLKARYVFPVEGPPIADGRVVIEGGRIRACEPAPQGRNDLDLGNVAILPGFVNAHTHLELTSLSESVPAQAGGRSPTVGGGRGPVDQITWLAEVIQQRRNRPPDTAAPVIEENLQKVISSGTTMLADTTTAGASWASIADAEVRALVFSEVLGLRRDRGLQTLHEAWSWLETVTDADEVRACARPGLSPHAPYSTAGWVYHRAAQSRLPLSTHLAELPDELMLLQTGGGRLREFLEELGAWDDEWEPIGASPAEYIRQGELRQSDWLVAHGTYLDPSDFWQLRPEAAPDDQRVAIAYCPRTHAYFGHAPHPYRKLLERGIIVCLGTDSLASSPTLSILDEMRFLHQQDGSLSGRLLLTMATLFGAWALRADRVAGSLKPGKSADLAILQLPDREAADPHDLILESELPVVATVFEGRPRGRL